jgi:hydroxymethylpyrimidine pyrophosphatase-like HAD family hydrolase
MNIIRSLNELDVQEGDLVILDYDKTLVRDHQLISSETPEWIRRTLKIADVVICTYRSFDDCVLTEAEIRELDMGEILDQMISPKTVARTWSTSSKNILYTHHKGFATIEFRTGFPKNRWKRISFVDDQPGALWEMFSLNPDVILYLIY